MISPLVTLAARAGILAAASSTAFKYPSPPTSSVVPLNAQVMDFAKFAAVEKTLFDIFVTEGVVSFLAR